MGTRHKATLQRVGKINAPMADGMNQTQALTKIGMNSVTFNKYRNEAAPVEVARTYAKRKSPALPKAKPAFIDLQHEPASGKLVVVVCTPAQLRSVINGAG